MTASLISYQHQTAGDQAWRIGEDVAEVEAHADGNQEHADQQAFERFDGDLDLTAELGLREQQAGDQRAQFHRQAHHGGGQSGGEDDQQAGGHEQLGAVGAGNAAEQRAQQESARHDQAEHDDDRLADRPGVVAALAGGLGAQHADDEQHRYRGDVLEQQHTERGSPERAAEPLLLCEYLNDDCGGRHRQSRTRHERQRRRCTQRVGRRSDRHGAQDELQQPQSEYHAAHHAQSFERQLQPDHEHQHADAELGDRGDRLGPAEHDLAQQGHLVCLGGDTERAHRDADQHEPQHWAEPQPVEQRDHDGRRGQDDEGGPEQPGVEVRAHGHTLHAGGAIGRMGIRTLASLAHRR